MSNIPYQIGTIKLTYINPDDYKILHGEMYDTIPEALAQVDQKNKGNNWLLFELIQTDGKSYSWKLLPYGKHRGYISGMKLRDNTILRLIMTAIFLYGIFTLGKLVVKKL